VKVLIIVLVVLLSALQYRLWFGDGSVQEVWRLKNDAKSKNAEVLRLRSRNQALEAEVADLKKGLDAIEERARTELGMISGDETFYRFVQNPDDPSSPDRTPRSVAESISGAADVGRVSGQ